MTPTTVLHNTTRLSRTEIDSALKGSASHVVERKAKVASSARGTTNMVTPKAGKPGDPYRRIVRYERDGPYYREVGHRWLNGERFPIIQGFYNHRFLHATKGWRVYTGGERMTLPHTYRHAPARVAFYGRHAA